MVSGKFFILISAGAGLLAFAGPAAGEKLLKPQAESCRRQFQNFLRIPRAGLNFSASAIKQAKALLSGKAPHQAGEGASAPIDSAGSAPAAPAGAESYRAALRREAEALLSRSVSRREEEALERANSMSGVLDSGGPERTKIKEKNKILKEAGFSKKEIRSLMESGIVWLRSITGAEALAKSLKRGRENIYFIDFEQNISRTRKIIGEDGASFKLETEVLGPEGPEGQRQIKTANVRKVFSEGFPDFGGSPDFHELRLWPKALHPDAQILFESAASHRKKAGRGDLNLSPPSDLEAALRRKGLGPAWTKGMNKLNEWADLRRQLQDIRANSRETHIQYFADQAHERIAFARESLGEMTKQQKKTLAKITREADKAVLNEAVSYEWWLGFNLSLSSLLADKMPHEIFLTNSGFLAESGYSGWIPLQSLILFFPLRMTLPATEGKIGIITLNRAHSEGLHFIGIAGGAEKADGQVMDPLQFASHDMLHAARNTTEAAARFSLGHNLKHKKMQELMDGLDGQKRKRAELVYFVSTFENGEEDILLNLRPREMIAGVLSKFFFKSLTRDVFSAKMAGLGKEYFDIAGEDGQIKYIREHVIEDFMREVYDPAF